MKRIIPALGLLVVAACQDASDPSTADQPSLAVGGQAAEQVRPGIVLARFQSGVSPEAVAPAYGLTVIGRGYANAFVELRGAVGNERALAARLGSDARVVYAEPDYLRSVHAVDPKMWAFHNPGGLSMSFTSGPNKGSPVTSLLSKADADEDNVENYAAGGGGVVISSIDTGVEFGHPAFLSGQLIAGQDWYSGDNDPSDQNGHGTHTTGTMVGQTVGVAGVSGAGPNVKVLVQRVCGAQFCNTSAIVNAIRAAADYSNMVAMNLSLGGSSLSSAEADAIAHATGKNVLVIASAGNGGTSTVSCPACDPNAISVAASDWMDQHAYYTNWGSGLDLIAPGGELYSNTTEEGGIYSSYTGGTYRYLQGTSMAAPQVTGTAAIVASKNSSLRGASLRTRLESTADDLGTTGWDPNFGFGRLNSYRAVTQNTLNEGSGGGTLTASFTYSCKGSATCTFDGSGSTLASSWSWDFGDNSNDETGQVVSHTFATVAEFEVTLTVSDGSNTASTSSTVSCTAKGKRIRCN